MRSFKTVTSGLELGSSRTKSLEDQHRELRRAITEGRDLPAGPLLGLPELAGGDIWVDIAGAAVLARVKPRTITSWLARKGPKRRPFPTPHRILYRLYWKRSDIERWLMTADA